MCAEYRVLLIMDHTYFDELDYFNFETEYDKMMTSRTGHAKHKAKSENHRYMPSGNVRKVVENIQNTEKREKDKRLRDQLKSA